MSSHHHEQARCSVKGLIDALSLVGLGVRSRGIVFESLERVVGKADATTRSGVITLSLAARVTSGRVYAKTGNGIRTITVASEANRESIAGLRWRTDGAEIVGAIIGCRNVNI